MADSDLNRLAERFIADLAQRSGQSLAQRTQPNLMPRATTVPNQNLIAGHQVTPRANQLMQQLLAARQLTNAQQPAPMDMAQRVQFAQDQSRAAMLADAANDSSNPVQVVPQQTVPQYISSPALRTRGGEDPSQQTRQYAAPMPQEPVTGGSELTPGQMIDQFLMSPAAQFMDPAERDNVVMRMWQQYTNPQPAQQEEAPPPVQHPQTVTGPPKDTNLQQPLTPEQSKILDQFINSPAAQMMDPAQFDSAYARLYHEVVPQKNLAASPFESALNRGWTGTRSGFNTVRESPPGQVVGKGINYALRAADYLQHENQKQMADVTYYMMTHNGELPEGFNKDSFFANVVYGADSEYQPSVQELSTPPDGFTFQEWLDLPEEQRKLILQQNHTDNPIASATMLSYLQEHPEQWDAAKKAYEAGGSEGLFSWYTETVGPWWSFASSLVMDPLNYALGLGVLGKGLKAKAVERAVQSGEEVSTGTKALKVGGEALKFAGDPLSYPIERLWEGLGWGFRRLPGTGYGRAATEQTITEGVEEGADIIRAGQGSEEEFIRSKNQAADQVEQQRRAQAAADQAKADADAARQAATEERAANAELQKAIKEGDARRAQEARGRAAAAKKEKEAAEARAAQKAKQQAAADERRMQIEEQHAANLKNAEISRNTQLQNAGPNATEARKARIENNYQAKLAKHQGTLDTQIKRWERKFGMPFAQVDETEQAAQRELQGMIEDANAREAARSAPQTTVPATQYFPESMGLGDALPDNVETAFRDGRIGDPTGYGAQRIPVEDVPTDAHLIATQDALLPDEIRGYVDDPARASTADMPIAIRDGDNYYVVEGHHRIAAAIERGDTSIQMRVLDATPPGQVETAVEAARAPIETTVPRYNARTGAVEDTRVNYLDADYVAKTGAGEPNFDRYVRDNMAQINPEAAARFRDDYRKLAIRYMEDDAALERKAADALNARGEKVTVSGLQTNERELRRAAFDAESEALFDLHFGRPSGYEPRIRNRTYPKKWIEQAYNGKNDAEHFQAVQKIRDYPTQIVPGRTNESIAADAEKRWRARFPDAEQPVAEAAPVQDALPQPTAPADAPLPQRFQDMVNDYRDDILSSDPDLSRAAAAKAHQLERAIPPEFRTAFREQINALRDQSGHIRSKAARKSARGLSNPGIVLDPKQTADQLYQATRNKVGQGIRKILRDPLDPAQEVKEVRNLTVNGVVRNDIKNPDELLGMINRGDLTQRQVDTLLEPREITVKVGGRVEKRTTNVWNQYQENLEKATAKRRTSLAKGGFPTDEEGVAALKSQIDAEYEQALLKTVQDLTPEGRRQSAVARQVRKAMGANRSYLQFNVVTGPKAIFKDVVGNLHLTALAGEGGAARYVPNLMWDFIKDDLDEVKMIDHPLFGAVKESGVDYLPTDLSHNVGREEVERRVLKTDRRSRIDPRNLGDSYWIRRIRGSNDNAYRHAIYLNKFGEELPVEQGKFLDFARKKLQQGAPQDLFDELDAMVKERFNTGRSFSPEEIRSITSKYGADDSYARTWAKQVDDLSQRANKAQRTVMFTYKKTKIDDALSKVFLFHYYMTRSSALYVKLMLQHPQLIGIEHELWEASQRSLDKYPGSPTWLKGFVAFGLGDGHVLYSNPFQFVSRMAAFQGLGDGGFSKSGVDAALNMTGLFLNPLWKTALAIGGYSNSTNPFGTSQLEKMLSNAIDQIRYSDFGREHGWDDMNHRLPTPELTKAWLPKVIDALNQGLRDMGVPIRDFKESDANRRSQDQIMGILITNAQDEGWDDARLAAAQTALLNGQPNPDVDAAIEEYTNLNMASSVGNAVIPSDAYVQDAATNERQQTEREAGQVPYDQRTPEQQQARDTNEIETIGSVEGQSLARGMQAYNNAGSADEQSIQDGMNQITNGYTDLPDWYTATIGGVEYSVADIKAMDDQERQDLAYTWAGEERTRRGMATGAKVSGPDYEKNNPNYSYAAERQQVKAEHPEIQDYLDYRNWTYDLEDPQQEIQGLLAVGDTEFSRAYHRQEDYLQSQGITGTELEDRMTQWFRSDEAYAALMGWQWMDKDKPGRATFNAVDLPPWREDVNAKDQQAQDKANQSTKDEGPPQLRGAVEDVGYFARDRARDYNDARYPYRRKKKTSTSAGGYPGMVLDYLLVPGT